jgi:hypothetical protein
MKFTCVCPHEQCGAEFTHVGGMAETTVCPECGRQQMPHPKQRVEEQLGDGRSRVLHHNGVVQYYLPNGAAENVDYD